MNHYKKTLTIIDSLKIKKPNYRFIGISIQPLNKIALEVNEMLGQSNDDQYSIINFENASKKWIITYLNKAIIMEPNGEIKNGFSNIFDPKFLNQL